MTITPSSSYLPEGLRSDPLFLGTTELIDSERFNLPKSWETDTTIDPLILNLIKSYENREALEAYYNLFIRPSLGTKAALESLLKIFKVDAKVKEWFEPDSNLPSYKFELIFESYPEGLDFASIINSINLIKNERSHLASMRDEDCSEIFILDKSLLDDDILDDAKGYTFKDVLLCFKRNYRPITLPYTYLSVESLTRIFSAELMYEEEGRLDFWDLDGARPLETPTIQSLLVSLLDIQSISEEYYNEIRHTATYESQIVLDEDGSLSGGEGFLGEEINDSIIYLDDYNLSEYEYSTYPILEFLWNYKNSGSDGSSIFNNMTNKSSSLLTLNYYLELSKLFLNINESQVIYSPITTHFTNLWKGPWSGSWGDAHEYNPRINHVTRRHVNENWILKDGVWRDSSTDEFSSIWDDNSNWIDKPWID